MVKFNLHNSNRHNHDIPKIGISGSADIDFLGKEVVEIGKELGKQIAEQGAILTSGATTGFPFWAAAGAKESKGVTIGFSPAANEREHVEVYRLPVDNMDVVIYTGFGYSGRDLLFTRSSDAVIIGPGRVGTFHEFSIAYEDQKPLGILRGGGLWETDKIIDTIIEKSHRENLNIIFDDNPQRLVARLIEMVIARKKKLVGYIDEGSIMGEEKVL